MGKYIAGIFSVPKYQSENFDNLPFCANDCIALKEAFNKHLGISDENINILGNDANQEVKKTEILRKVRYISGIAEPDDIIIFYFSGHGFSENNFGYLATYDTEFDLASDTSIQILRIREELERSKAKRKMLIIDSCYSGIKVGKKFDPRMSEDFEKSLFSNISEGWAIFASCKRKEVSYPLEDNSMSVFTSYLIEGLKGNADTDKDSNISLQDLSLYVTKMVSKWAVEHDKIQNPNIEMQLVGTLTFTINNPETSEFFSPTSESNNLEKIAQNIVLISSYVPDSWTEIYDDFGQPTGESKEVPQEVRKNKVIKNRENFIGHLFATLINYYKPSQIKLKENDEYELPFGKLVYSSKSPFENEFKLILTKDLFTPTIINLLNSIDDQTKIKWNSIEYIFKGNFDFDVIIDIAKEKGYSVLEYQPKQNYSYLRISQEEKSEGWVVKSKWMISFENEP